MARKRSAKSKAADVVVTADRAARLYRILKLLGKGSQKRETLTGQLKVGVRDFYRDLKVLREIGIVPVWVCPLREPAGRGPFPLYRLSPGALYVNFGFWDVVRDRVSHEEGHFNRLIEAAPAVDEPS